MSINAIDMTFPRFATVHSKSRVQIKVHQWFSSTKLSLNSGKTHILIFLKACTNSNLPQIKSTGSKIFRFTFRRMLFM